MLVIAVCDASADISHLAQTAQRISSLVVDVGDAGAIAEGGGGNAVEHIVLVRRGLVLRIGARLDVTGIVTGVDGVAGIRTAGLDQVVQAVDRVSRMTDLAPIQITALLGV